MRKETVPQRRSVLRELRADSRCAVEAHHRDDAGRQGRGEKGGTVGHVDLLPSCQPVVLEGYAQS